MSNETQFLIDSLVEHLTLRVMEEYGLSITENRGCRNGVILSKCIIQLQFTSS